MIMIHITIDIIQYRTSTLLQLLQKTKKQNLKLHKRVTQIGFKLLANKNDYGKSTVKYH